MSLLKTDTESITFDKRGCSSLLRKHPELKKRIIQTIESQIQNGFFKSKFATSIRWNNSPIWECRVNEKTVGSVRVAFSVYKDSIKVLYISSTLQKKAFTTELNQFLGKGRS